MKLNQKQRHQLANVLNSYFSDEERDYSEAPYDDKHIYLDLKDLNKALNAYNRAACKADCCMICGTVTNRPLDTGCGNPCEPAKETK